MKRPNSRKSKRIPDPKRQERFHQQIREKSSRKLKAKREEEFSIWYGLGMFGLIGWSVAIPTLIGVAIGLWIDFTYPSPYSWTLMLLFVGVVLGCLNAWFWVQRERPNE